MRTSERTRRSSSCWSKGFVTKSSAPARMPSMRASESCEVTITTGMSPVASSSRIRRQTSYPFIPAIWTSRRTRSGSSATTRSSASGPDDAGRTEQPAGSRIPSSSRTLAAKSSTTRIWACGSFWGLASVTQELPHLVGELADAGRLREIAVETLGDEALFVAAHGRGRERDDRDRCRARIFAQQLQRLRAAEVGHSDVHQDKVGLVLHGQGDPLDAARRHDGVEAGELEHVAGELPIVLVVVDDQDQPGHDASCRTGSVKRKALP